MYAQRVQLVFFLLHDVVDYINVTRLNRHQVQFRFITLLFNKQHVHIVHIYYVLQRHLHEYFAAVVVSIRKRVNSLCECRNESMRLFTRRVIQHYIISNWYKNEDSMFIFDDLMNEKVNIISLPILQFAFFPFPLNKRCN